MSFEWIAENPPYWDADKARLVGDAPQGIFDTRYSMLKPGDLVPGTWFRAEETGNVVGYGWLDVNWGDAEILLATTGDARGRGVGTFILDQLEREAHRRGLNYLYNLVRPTHPEADTVTAWLQKRGFSPDADGRLQRPVFRTSTVRASEMPPP